MINQSNNNFHSTINYPMFCLCNFDTSMPLVFTYILIIIITKKTLTHGQSIVQFIDKGAVNDGAV